VANEGRLVQTRIPTSLARWLEERARVEGLTVAALLRRMIATAKEVGSDRFIGLERRVQELERRSAR
jgi:hypothetical protein